MTNSSVKRYFAHLNKSQGIEVGW